MGFNIRSANRKFGLNNLEEGNFFRCNIILLTLAGGFENQAALKIGVEGIFSLLLCSRRADKSNLKVTRLAILDKKSQLVESHPFQSSCSPPCLIYSPSIFRYN